MFMGKEIKRCFRYLWPPLIVASIIFYLCCLITPSDIPSVEIVFFIPTDKLVHFIMFFGLSGVASVNYILVRKGNIIILKLIALAILVPILYGGLIEIIQKEYIDGRSGDWYDFLADALGSLASIPFSLGIRRYLLNKNHDEI